MAQKWDVLRIWCAHLVPPHYKYCICIDWDQKWFFYINSEKPYSRKAQQHAVEVSNFEIVRLHKNPSYIDTTTMITNIDSIHAIAADGNQEQILGPLLPTVRQRIVDAVRAHGALDPDYETAVLLGEP